MATLYFTTNADSGAGSLRATIAAAADGDVILPDATVFDRATTIVVALASTLTVSKAVTIDGGANRIRLSGYNIARCCTASAVATFRNVDFVGGGVNPDTGAQIGSPSGAGLQATASVTCERCGFYGCSGAYGGGVIGGSSATVSLDSCVVAGCRATNGGGVRIAGSAIIKNTTFAGNVATNASGIDDVLADAAATSVVVENVILHEKSASVALGAGCVAVDASSVGFVAPPPAGYDANSWTYNAWQNWDLRLLDDASPNPSPYRDSGDVDAASTYDFDGNFRGREADGVSACSPGAYETIQADLFWIGIPFFAPGDLRITGYDSSTRRATLNWTANLANTTGYNIQQSANGGSWSALSDSSGAATSRLMGGLIDGSSYAWRIRAFNETRTSPWSIIRFTAGSDDATTEYETTASSWGNADGWAASRFASSSGDVAPQAGQTFFVDGTVDFDDAAPQNATLNVGGRGVVSVDGGSSLDLSLGLGATFFLSASATLRRFAPFAKLNWVSGDLTVGGDVLTATLDVPSGSTLNVDGGFICVGDLTVAGGASVAFSSERGDAVLTATESATVGAASFSGTGYFATPPETDASSASFAETVRACDYGANVSSFSASPDTATVALLSWVKQNSTPSVLIEEANGSAWNVVNNRASGDSLFVDISAPKTFRIFDGEKFFTASARPYGTAYELAEEQTIGYLKTLISTGYLN